MLKLNPSAALAALLSAALLGCGSSDPVSRSSLPAGLKVRVSAAGKVLPDDILGLRVSGQGMEPVLEERPFAETVVLEGLPPGEARVVEGWLADSRGRRVYYGSDERDLPAGQTAVSLELEPLFADLEAALPLGADNPAGVAGGLLALVRPGDTIVAALEIGAFRGTFSAERVLFADDWRISVRIWGGAGDTLFALDAPFPVDAGSREIALDLSTTQTSLELSISLKEPSAVRARLSLPRAGKRVPAAPGELVFSELFPYPKTAGDDWEWIELANATSDTLLLEGCAVAKSRGSTAASTRLELPADLAVPPAETVVLGRDSVDFADWNYGAFVMANTRQTMMILCGGVAVDSLEYMPAADSLNPFPVREGRSIELDPERIAERTSGAAWCEGRDEFDFGSWTGLGTPGELGDCGSDEAQ